MTKRGKRERLAMIAATAWNMAELGRSLDAIADKLYVTRDYVWHLLEIHQKARARR